MEELGKYAHREHIEKQSPKIEDNEEIFCRIITYYNTTYNNRSGNKSNTKNLFCVFRMFNLYITAFVPLNHDLLSILDNRVFPHQKHLSILSVKFNCRKDELILKGKENIGYCHREQKGVELNRAEVMFENILNDLAL